MDFTDLSFDMNYCEFDWKSEKELPEVETVYEDLGGFGEFEVTDDLEISYGWLESEI